MATHDSTPSLKTALYTLKAKAPKIGRFSQINESGLQAGDQRFESAYPTICFQWRNESR